MKTEHREYNRLYATVLAEHKQVFEAQDFAEIEHCMGEIERAGRIFVIGAGREGIAARSFAMRLMHMGKPTYWIWDDTTPGMKEGDLLIAVNGSGNVGHISYLTGQAAGTGAETIVFTGAPDEISEKITGVFVPATVYKGRDKRTVPSVQPMGNLFEQHLFLLFDIIIMLLVGRLQQSAEEMESRHRNVE